MRKVSKLFVILLVVLAVTAMVPQFVGGCDPWIPGMGVSGASNPC